MANKSDIAAAKGTKTTKVSTKPVCRKVITVRKGVTRNCGNPANFQTPDGKCYCAMHCSEYFEQYIGK
jgi:hypothetical protein